jgi:hypothetical protein
LGIFFWVGVYIIGIVDFIGCFPLF